MPLAEAQPPVQFAPGKKDKKGKKGKEPAQQAVIEETPVVVVAELDELLSALDAVDCGETAARGLLRWFAVEDKEDKGRWSVRVNDMVREVGIGLLEEGGVSSGARLVDNTRRSQLNPEPPTVRSATIGHFPRSLDGPLRRIQLSMLSLTPRCTPFRLSFTRHLTDLTRQLRSLPHSSQPPCPPPSPTSPPVASPSTPPHALPSSLRLNPVGAIPI